MSDKGLLSDITVLSLEQATTLPFLTQRLARDGARVIRVEAPLRGDPNRYVGRNLLDEEGMASYFLPNNCGKQALTINLGHPEGRSLLHEVTAALRVDIFATNSRFADSLHIPARLTVVPPPGPRLTVNKPSLNFDTVGIGDSRQRTVRIKNIGAATLTVTGITTLHPQYTASPASFTLASLETTLVTITFSPASGGLLRDTVQFVSNDSLAQRILLSGTGVPVPHFAANVDSLVKILEGGTGDSLTFFMSNIGSASGSFAAHAVVYPDSAGPASARHSVVIPMTVRPATLPAKNGKEMWRYADPVHIPDRSNAAAAPQRSTDILAVSPTQTRIVAAEPGKNVLIIQRAFDPDLILRATHQRAQDGEWARVRKAGVMGLAKALGVLGGVEGELPGLDGAILDNAIRDPAVLDDGPFVNRSAARKRALRRAGIPMVPLRRDLDLIMPRGDPHDPVARLEVVPRNQPGVNVRPAAQLELFRAHEVGMRKKHVRCFELAAVNRLPGRGSYALVRLGCQENWVEAGKQDLRVLLFDVLRGNLDHRKVGQAMTVEGDDPREAVVNQRSVHILEEFDDGLGSQRDGPGLPHVVGRIAEPDGRGAEDPRPLGYLLRVVDGLVCIRSRGQMRPMALRAPDGNDRRCIPLEVFLDIVRCELMHPHALYHRSLLPSRVATRRFSPRPAQPPGSSPPEAASCTVATIAGDG